MRLTPHFDTREFACHDGTPCPVHAYGDVQRLCRTYLEPLRGVYGPVTIISGYRHEKYNRLVGGAPNSFHIYRQHRPGAAADVACERGTASQWHATLARLNPGGLGRYDSHVHVDNRTGHARW